jgi:hypothetical protein
MNNYKIIYPLLFFSILFFCGCKKTGKEILEKVSKESVERTGREIAKESSERTIRTISKKELKNIDWRGLLKLIRKENINLAEALQKLDGSFQKKIGKAIKNDYEFYSALVSSNTFVDEFAVLAKGAPKAADDINIFKYFVKCRDMERRFGVPNSVSNFALKEEMGVIKFLDKGTNKVLGEFKDGVYLIKEPFKKGASLLDNSSVLKKTLIPNTVYKIKGANGQIYLYHVDDLGRFSKIEARGINADKLVSNVILAKENLNLGSEWAAQLKKIRQTSKGGDIEATIVLKYADDGTTPLVVKADVKAGNKKVVSQSFENLDNVSKRAFTTAENSALLDKVVSKTGLSVKKKADLLSEMNQDDELAKLIHSNPDFNVKRWLNTRNHVDKGKVARTANGRMVPNGQVYAGNVYYFNPHLNSGLKVRLKNSGIVNLKKFGSLSYDDLIKLDKLYPDGVPFTKEGYPDFTKVAFKDKRGQTLKINIGQLSGDSKKDIQKAEALFQKMGYQWESGYTWHHIENSTELIRVPSAIHQLIDHAGGMSTHTTQQVVKQAA